MCRFSCIGDVCCFPCIGPRVIFRMLCLFVPAPYFAVPCVGFVWCVRVLLFMGWAHLLLFVCWRSVPHRCHFDLTLIWPDISVPHVAFHVLVLLVALHVVPCGAVRVLVRCVVCRVFVLCVGVRVMAPCAVFVRRLVRCVGSVCCFTCVRFVCCFRVLTFVKWFSILLHMCWLHRFHCVLDLISLICHFDLNSVSAFSIGFHFAFALIFTVLPFHFDFTAFSLSLHLDHFDFTSKFVTT